MFEATASALYSADNKLKSQCLSLAAASTLTFLVYKLYKNSRKSISNKDSLLPPTVKGGLPLIGHLLELEKNPSKYLDDAKNVYGPCFRLSIPGQGNLVVVTGSLIGEVMKTPKNFSFTRGIEKLVPARQVVCASYDHKFVGEAISPRDKHPIVYPVKHNFKENQLEIFSGRIQKALKTALDEQLNLEKGQERAINILETLTLIISYISCSTFAGSKIGNNKELIDGMAHFTHKIIKAGIFMSALPTGLGHFIVRHFVSVEHEMDLIMQLLVPELEKIRNGQAGNDYEVTFATMTLNLPKADGSPRDVKDAAYYFNNIALASIHTTSHFASFALHELACRPALVQDLRDELATLGNNRTPESVAKLPLMDSFFREVLRYNADYLGMHHLTIEDTTLSTGHFIPKGSLVVGAIEQVHRDMSFLPVDEETGEPLLGNLPLEEFDAYRFVGKKVKSTTVGLDHLAFGLGAHACPGRFFAANEIKYVLAEMLVRYDIKTKSGKRAPDTVLLGMTKFPPREPLIFTGL